MFKRLAGAVLAALVLVSVLIFAGRAAARDELRADLDRQWSAAVQTALVI